MSETLGRSVALSPARRIICDLLDAGVRLPLIPFERTINVADLAAARLRAQPRPSWCSIFTKAYAKVVSSRPVLRRAFLAFPWERLYEYQRTTMDIAVQTRQADEDVLVFVAIKNPETRPLGEIDRILSECRANPVERLKRFRRACFLARMPRFVRRLVWWGLLNISGYKRSRYFGTFGASSVANWGVESLRPIAPCTTVLHYGTLDPAGNVALRVTFDHRVMDGNEMALALVDMERVLRTEILAEVLASGGSESFSQARKAG